VLYFSDCGDASPANGTVIAPKGTTYGEVVIVSCDTGYTLIGDSFIACEADSTWSSSPTCLRGRTMVIDETKLYHSNFTCACCTQLAIS